MSAKPEQEPSIEEILASIRQIISDDDAPKEAAVDLSQKPSAPVEPMVAKVEPPETPPGPRVDEVLDLTNEVREEPKSFAAMAEEKAPPIVIKTTESNPKPSVDLDLAEHIDKPAPSFASAPNNSETDALFTATAAAATKGAFSKLMSRLPIEREENEGLYSDGKITLEDMVRDMLRPMLREWIDQNMPDIVERLVEKELEKLARKARDE